WYCYTAYYDLLADAFLHGRTALPLRPDPKLLSLPDPYDPEQNREYRLHDALLYQGRYYLYWGPAPALIVAPIKALWRTQIGDQYLVFAATAGMLAVTAFLLTALRRRLFPALPWWVHVPGLLAVGLGHPIPLVLARAAIYEAAIATAQFFLLGGLFWAFTALSGNRCVPWRLAAAGVCWTLALCSRLSLALAVAVLTVLVAWRLYRLRGGSGRFGKDFAIPLGLLAVPLLAGAAALAAYNHVRFGSWYEFGMRYQLAGYNIHAVTATGVGAFAGRFALPGLYAYWVHPFAVTGRYPFVAMSQAIFRSAPVPGEAVAGALWALPYLWLGLIPVAGLGVGLVTRCLGRAERNGSRELLDWFSLCLLSAGLCGMAPVLFIDGCQNRYLADGLPTLLILATLGAWTGLAALGTRPHSRRVFLGLVSGSTLATALVGVLLGVSWQEHCACYRTRSPSEWYPWKTSVQR
ncbi:MAG TPA: hypothetical protein VG013_02725, partial [Gemmataceae bacterium]|nr:hypothetical protein [Gemmataceae bacterium]